MNNRILKALPFFFLITRFALLLSFSVESLRGYGDYIHFYRLAGMGWPFINLWVEFPPLFPFLSAVLFRLTGGRQHAYDYILTILLALFQAGSIAVFVRLVQRIHSEHEQLIRALMYTALLAGIAYGWWYFDPIAEFFMLLGILWLLQGKDNHSGLAIAIGVLAKWFPALVLPLAWKRRPPRKALLITVLALGIPLMVYAVLYVASPRMTVASVSAQGSKGSWETVWALIDGNLGTGNFGPEIERYQPDTAGNLRGYPARLPPWLTLIPFAILGAWIWRRAQLDNDRSALAFLGLTWCLFLLWSPGWSTQWVLYLLPFILLALPERESLLFALTLVFINLLEWPVLLSRGYNWGLWLTITIRTLLLILLAVAFWQTVKRNVAVSAEGLELNTPAL